MAPFVKTLVGKRVHVHETCLVVGLEQVGTVDNIAKTDLDAVTLNDEKIGSLQYGVGLCRYIAQCFGVCTGPSRLVFIGTYAYNQPVVLGRGQDIVIAVAGKNVFCLAHLYKAPF